MSNHRPEGCVCRDIETDWNVDGTCGGVFTTSVIKGVSQATKEPGCCETHMKPWGHRRDCAVHDQRAIEPESDHAHP